MTFRPLSCVLAFVVVSAAAIGCGPPPPPKELVAARANYKRAKAGLANRLAPAELDTAKQSLVKAEAAFEDDPEGQPTRDLAYIADRRALLAEAAAGITAAERDKATAEKAFKEYSSEELARARAEVKEGQTQLKAERKELEAERARRKAAERELSAALKSLHEVATVKEEKRGVVITMAGAVLFAPGRSELMPIARVRLDQVNAALKDQGSPPLRIEGHTDSTGSAVQNRALSLQRAEAVKSHLVSQGYPSAKITTVGHGPDRPVADNTSVEGKANNRRVEIVVNPTD
jgi:outer membrane protein OmpA-like peptidoglycan-associated protein